jgi:hypothetical protein
MKDPGVPLISVIIDDTTFNRALLDLGASVNIIPTSLFEEFQIGELKPVEVTLQLADRSTIKPRGIVEDVLVKVQNCVFPADFLVLDIEAPESLLDSPIILGRPFLATAKANINCHTGKMDINCAGQTITLDIFKSSRRFHDDNFFEDSDTEISNMVEETMLIDTLTDHSFFEDSDSDSVVGEICDPETCLDSKFVPDTPPNPPTIHAPNFSTLTHHSFPDPFLTDLPPTPPEFGTQPELKPWPDSGHTYQFPSHFDPNIISNQFSRDLDEDTFFAGIQVSNYLHDFPSSVHTFTPG